MEGDQAVGLRQHVDPAIAVPVYEAHRAGHRLAGHGEQRATLSEGQEAPAGGHVLIAQDLVLVGRGQEGDEEVLVAVPVPVHEGRSQPAPVAVVMGEDQQLAAGAERAPVDEAVPALVLEHAEEGRGAALDQVEVPVSVEVGEGVVAAGRDLPAAVDLAQRVAVPHQARITK